MQDAVERWRLRRLGRLLWGPSGPQGLTWRLFARELGVLLGFGLVMTAVFAGVVYPALGLPATGPEPLRTVGFLVLITIMLHRRGERWSDFGLVRWPSWWTLAAMSVALLAVKLFILQPVSDAIRVGLQLPAPDHAFFAHIEGSLPALALWLVIAWLVGGFAEELVFRGYLMNRIGMLLGGRRVGWVIAVTVQALIFGLGHAYVGLTGAVSGTLTALVYGAFVLLAKRRLWPVILVHGLWDSLGVILLYLHGTPGS